MLRLPVVLGRDVLVSAGLAGDVVLDAGPCVTRPLQTILAGVTLGVNSKCSQSSPGGQYCLLFSSPAETF